MSFASLSLRVPVGAALVLCLLNGPVPIAQAAWVATSQLAVSIVGEPTRDPISGGTVVTVQVRNSAAEALTAPLRLIVEHGAIAVRNADGTTDDGRPWFALPVPGAGLAPGTVTDPMHILLAENDQPAAPIVCSVELDDQPFTLQLLHASDIDSTSPAAALHNVKGFSALLAHFRADPTRPSLTVSSGDNWIPGPRYNAANDPRLAAVLGLPGFGRGDVALLNAMGFAASTLGNHELDREPAEFVSVIAPETRHGQTWPGAAFPYLSANLDFTREPATTPLVAANGVPASTLAGRVAGWATVTVGGQTIGLIGASTPTLPSITTPAGIGVSPKDPADLDALAAVLQRGVDALVASGVNKIILLAHMQQIAVEQALAPRLRGVDIIVAGGSNTRLFDADDLPWPGDDAQGTYPLRTTGTDGRPVLIVNTDGDYKYLGRLVATFDALGVLDPARLDPALNGAWATSREGLARLGLTTANAEPRLTAVADPLLTVLLEKQDRVLGLSKVYLDGDRNTVRRQESNLGDLTADANLWWARQQDPTVQISIKNGGGIRSPIGLILYPPGATDLATAKRLPPYGGRVSQLDVEGALAFNNGLTLLTLTAAQLVETLEYGFAAATPQSTPGQFPQVGGLRLSWDPNRPPGARLRNLAVVDDHGAIIDALMRDGALLGEPTRRLRVVTLDFLANGGDGYPLPGFTDCDRVDLTQPPDAPRSGRFTFAADGSEQDVLAEYLATFHATAPYNQPETAPAADARIETLSAAGRAGSVSAR